MIIDCISDLHGHYPKLEGGDLLIVAGDLTVKDSITEFGEFDNWICMQNYKKKVVVAGNHDNCFQHSYTFKEMLLEFRVSDFSWEYLCDSATEFQDLKIWGSPWTKRFEGMNPHCMAFTVETDEELAEKWAMIPADTDILITHGPPFTILDKTIDGDQVGSASLMAFHLSGKFRPKLWVFGHIHEAYGKIKDFQWNSCTYVNASHVNERYEPVNKPIRIEL